jgi:hypothetical protein
VSWAQYHTISESLAAEAEVAYRAHRFDDAVSLYGKAAAAEEEALKALDPSKVRTIGITAVSAISLWFKGRQYKAAENLAHSMLTSANLPAFAVAELRSTLQAIWNEEMKKTASISFLPGQLLVAMDGGVVMHGAAPLDLVVEKIEMLKALFYRGIELVLGHPHRMRGLPRQDILELFRPWVFQELPGSYQFSVAVQKPLQADFFQDEIEPELITSGILKILKATTVEDGVELQRIVPDKQYRTTFLKLSRNLAPTGKTFSKLRVKAAGEAEDLVLVKDTRTVISRTIREETPRPKKAGEEARTLHGTLRAVHLDADWLELITDQGPVHVDGLKETIDDVIGPLVNRRVVVETMFTSKGKYRFVDIEAEE